MNKLVNNIWSFTNEVRGYLEISELKEIIVSLIFLKHASDEYLSNPFSEISVPEKSQYTFLAENLNNSDLMNYLWDAFDAIEIENVQLRNTLTNFNFRNRFNNKDDFYLIQNLIIKICEFGLLEEDISFSNFIGQLLSKFALSEGKTGGDINTPDSVTQLMVQLLNPEKGTVLDSTCGLGGFFQEIKDNYPNNEFQFYGQEYNWSILALVKLRYAFNKKNNIQFGEGKSTLSHDQFPELKADYVIMHPPFNLRLSANEILEGDPRFEFGVLPKSNANLAWIQHAIFHLNNKGKAALLLSNSSLSAGGKELGIRKNVIEADLLEAIITLPSQLLANTSIPSSIWVLNKNKVQKNKVLFIDASNLWQMTNRGQRVLSYENIIKIVTQFNDWQANMFNSESIGFSNSVLIKEIANNDYTLTPARYIGVKELNEVNLSNAIKFGEILEYIRPERLDPNVTYKKVSIKDLSSNPDSYLIDTSSLKEGELRQDYRLLEDYSLLIARLGSKLKPTYFEGAKEKLAFSSNSIYFFKVDLEQVRIDYLIAELDKDYVKAQVDNFRKGAGIPFVKRQDLENILIIIPSLEEQKEIIEKERELRFQSAAKELGFEKEIEKLKQAQMKDLGSKKHNIMQHLNNVKASADVLSDMMSMNKGILKSDTIIDPRRGITVEKRFIRLQESLSKVIYYVDNITNELKFDEAEIINVGKFIKECKERGIQNELFSVDILIEKETFHGKEPLINISKNDFEEVYNNLLENAMNHGFLDEKKKYIFRVSIVYIDGSLELNFENNGKPFPKGISEKIDIKGAKAGKTGGTGIGLWKVAEIAKHFDCTLEVLDEPESEFPVGFKFKFNLETV
jgi:type I restriction enzyme M protein